MSLAIGDRAPDLSLPDTDGVEHALHEHGEPSVVVFTCNHCPYALAWHDRILEAAGDYSGTRCALPRGEPQRRRALPGRLPGRDARAGGGRRRLADPLPARREPGRRARVRRQDHPGRVRARRRRAGCATAARRTPTTWTRAQNAAWLREALDALLGGRGPAAAGDRAGGLQRQVEAVTAATTASVSSRSSSTRVGAGLAQLLHAVGAARHRHGAGARLVGRLHVERRVAHQHRVHGRRVLRRRPLAGHRHQVRAGLVRVGAVARPPRGRASARGRTRPASPPRWRPGCR